MLYAMQSMRVWRLSKNTTSHAQIDLSSPSDVTTVVVCHPADGAPHVRTRWGASCLGQIGACTTCACTGFPRPSLGLPGCPGGWGSGSGAVPAPSGLQRALRRAAGTAEPGAKLRRVARSQIAGPKGQNEKGRRRCRRRPLDCQEFRQSIADQTLRRRRAATPSPIRPAPRRPSVAGSGTVVKLPPVI